MCLLFIFSSLRSHSCEKHLIHIRWMFKGITFNKAGEIDAVEETLARCSQAARDP